MSKVGMPPPSELAGAQHDAETLACLLRRAVTDQRIDDALLRLHLGLGLHRLALLLAGHVDGAFHQVADDLLDVAPDVTDLGELGRLDLDKGRLGEFRQAARDFRLADAGRADHQDVLRHHLLAHVIVELLAPPAVAERDGDGALGIVLADDVAVELGYDFSGGEAGHDRSMVSMVTLLLV
jgi:hypothetical protein